MFEKYLIIQITMLCEKLGFNESQAKDVLECSQTIIRMIPRSQFPKFTSAIILPGKIPLRKKYMKVNKVKDYTTKISYIFKQQMNAFAEVIFLHALILRNHPIHFEISDLHKLFAFYPTGVENALIVVFESIVNVFGFKNLLKQYIKKHGIDGAKQLGKLLFGENILSMDGRRNNK